MVVASDSRTALKWWIAVELRRLRESSGLTREQAAHATKGSIQAIGHFETGRTLPGPLQLDVLLELYGVPERIDHFQELRGRAKRDKDWWIEYGDAVPELFHLFLGLETHARRIESWDAHLVRGLFQTRDTVRALIGTSLHDAPLLAGTRPSPGVDELIELRMARQLRVLDRPDPPLIRSVTAESALHWQIGGSEVHRAQLRHLCGLAERPNIEIQVLPFSAGSHAGTEGSFTMFSAPADLTDSPGCVYVENRIRGHYYDSGDELRTFGDELAHLRAQALSPARSLAFISELADAV